MIMYGEFASQCPYLDVDRYVITVRDYFNCLEVPCMEYVPARNELYTTIIIKALEHSVNWVRLLSTQGMSRGYNTLHACVLLSLIKAIAHADSYIS
jgi:hypothetical protein